MGLPREKSKTFCEVVELKNELNIQQPFIVENGAAAYLPVDYFDTTWPKALNKLKELSEE